jgi:hypothetical protein
VKNSYFHRILCGGKNVIINYFYDNYDKEIGFLRTSAYAKLAKCSSAVVRSFDPQHMRQQLASCEYKINLMLNFLIINTIKKFRIWRVAYARVVGENSNNGWLRFLIK